MITEKNKTDDSITYEVNISKKHLLDKIHERIKKYTWTNALLADNVDYKEFQIEENKIKIKRKPTNLTTFGQIELLIEELTEEKSNLKFDIIPFNKLFPWGRPILIAFGLFLTVFGLLIDRSIYTLLIIVSGWSFLSVFLYFRMKFERHMMFRYTKLIVKDLS